MKKPYQKISPNSGNAIPITPYQRARQIWDERIGTSRVQAKNWRLLALLTSLLAVLLGIALLISLALKQNKVFVAEVGKAGQVINVVPLRKVYEPSRAAKEYFLGTFIKLIRELPLDPVLAKKNWLKAYNFLTPRSVTQLNHYLRKNNPLALLGKQTISVQITDVNPLSANTFNLQWQETYIDLQGKNLSKKSFSAVFTIALKAPKTETEILKNPLGIYIVDFHVTERV